MAKYQRYQDYVIKDGKFVGEFEQMYRDFEDPWDQTTREEDAFEKLIAVELVRRHGHRRVLEIGCGYGEFTAKLARASESVLGIDVSETAINTAKQRHPELKFEVADIMDKRVYQLFQPDCIVMAEISWYVLEKLNAFRSFLKSEMSGANVGFIHLLMTYREGEQKYGREYFTNLDQIMRYWNCVKFEKWGVMGCEEYLGGNRTFCYGTIT